MKRSIDDISSTMLFANKKRSKPTPREQRRIKRDKVREEQNTILHANPTPREQGHFRRDKPILMAAISVLVRTRAVIGVTETGSGKAAAFVSRKPKMRVIIPTEKFRFSFD
ncbi:hypothetical protein Tco_0581372 [Tanacetum coccineum]